MLRIAPFARLGLVLALLPLGALPAAGLDLRGTYLGGADATPPCTDTVRDVVATATEVYVLGTTACDGLPGSAGGAFADRAGKRDVFLARLSLDLGTLLQATYFGGAEDEYAGGLAVTGEAVYAAGTTLSVDLPGTSLGAQTDNVGADPFDGFVARFDRQLTALVQATYLGGDDAEEVLGIAVGASSVYLVGATMSLDFPGAAGGAQPALSGYRSDGFVARLPLSLQAPIRSTFLGAVGWDYAASVVVAGNTLFVAGSTASTGFPGAKSGPQPQPGAVDPELASTFDAFVARLSVDLAQIHAASYLGGEADDYGFDVAAAGDSVYLTGTTHSTDLPFTAGGAQPASAAPPEAFVARFDRSLTGAAQATYLGGGSSSSGSVLWAGAGEVLVAGSLGEAPLGHVPGPGGTDAYLAILDETLAQLVATTRFGGSADDSGRGLGVARDDLGAIATVWIGGGTGSADLPLADPAALPTRNGTRDGFVARTAKVP